MAVKYDNITLQQNLHFMPKGVISFKDPGFVEEALLAAACIAGHGNKSQIIIESVKANPAVKKELDRLSKKKSK